MPYRKAGSMLDIHFEVGGRKVRPNDIANELERLVYEGVADMISAKLSGVRDPETGEFPIVAVRGRSLDNLTFEISGSDAVVKLATERLNEPDEDSENDGAENKEEISVSAAPPPRVFVSHASEDKDIAEKVARGLRAKGIDAWLDQWELSFGDALQSAISKGIDDAGIFLVVMSHAAREKPWVKAEIDAAWVDKMAGRKRFIVARSNIDHDELPGLLRGPLSADLDHYDDTIARIVNLAFGITDKPPLGPAPEIVSDRAVGPTGLSPAAERIAKLYCLKSEYGLYCDPAYEPQELMNETGLTLDEMVDAVDELEARGAVWPEATLGCGAAGFSFLSAEAALFTQWDKFFMGWSPEDDALTIASDLHGGSLTGMLAEDADKLGWPVRRLNAAVAWLDDRKIVDCSRECGVHPFYARYILATKETRRFVTSRS